ncbi:unnamed protein product [Parascedosporium putredinis]|uniref:BTB domain-containing protein n=1 Tax=Parascedosporium putredinis TaxID=1442378 RepID=A0A9P1M6C9_9PEZI|nr:unnamed protein product [Parascedosporium putredinis]CAI7988255.1 unnamed protein product [Parascedosporium putredinis]
MVLRKHELELKLYQEKQMIQNGLLRDENPLDLSDEFNQLASLCGHYELVELLLESGALAERNTFQGERCVYNALNNKIRNLLLQYDFSKSTDPLQAWSAHLNSLLSRLTPQTSDITVSTNGQGFGLHKFLLYARSPYFQRKLAAAPATETWKIQPSIPIEAFRIVTQYLYLQEVPRDLVDAGSTSTEEEVLKGIDKITKDLEIDTLWETILAMNDRRLVRQRYQDEVNRAQEQIEQFFNTAIVGNKMVVDADSLHKVKWPQSNAIFADCLLAAYEESAPVSDEKEKNDNTTTLPPPPEGPASAIPVGPIANETEAGGQEPRKVVLYPAHKAMLIRSPYFETMFSSEFREAQESEHLHIITLDCVPEVLEIILAFLYTEKANCPLELGLDLLYAADMLFLDKLKTKAATVISALGSGNSNVLVDRTHATAENAGAGDAPPVEAEPINIYDVIHAAWDLRVQRLEEFAARYLAYRLEDYIDDDEFADLIRQSAERIQKREETDTIELLDDIRYYLSERFRLRFQDAGLENIMDEEGEIDVSLAESLANQAALTGAQEVDQGDGVIRTLDGEVVEDEFDSDAINYQILLGKIDVMLEKLKLDA